MVASYQKISEKLDYKLTSVEDRLEYVNELIDKNDEFLVKYYDNHYNPHINQTGVLSEKTKVGKDLEALADYILYAKDSDASDDTITDYRKRRNNVREASIENMMKVRDFKKETNKSIIKTPKIKVNKQDRLDYPELRQTGNAIKMLGRMIKSREDSKGNKLNDTEVRKLKWIRTDIQKDEIAIKNELKGYIRFQSITKPEKDLGALGHIRFDDAEIIRILVEDYSELKQLSYEDTFGYMKIIMFAFDDLVDKTNFDDYLKEVIMCKIDNVQYDEIIERLYFKYDVKMTKPRLSKLIRETIPKMIVETYKQQKEEWLYTYIMKGEYKTCSECNDSYLATTKYFHKTSNGLRAVCKECRKKKYKSSVAVKSE